MTIRRAINRDHLALKNVAYLAYDKYCANIGRPPAPMVADFKYDIANNTVFVWNDETINGYAVLSCLDGVWTLDNIAVDPKAQGAGIGKKLISACESWLIENHVTSYQLYVNVVMLDNISWYQRLGFVEVERKNVDGFDRVYMSKNF